MKTWSLFVGWWRGALPFIWLVVAGFVLGWELAQILAHTVCRNCTN